MAIKHSPVKNLIFILISLWFGGFSAWDDVDYLTSSNPYKDTSFFVLSLLVAAFFLLLLIFAIRRLTIHATILSFDHENVTSIIEDSYQLPPTAFLCSRLVMLATAETVKYPRLVFGWRTVSMTLQPLTIPTTKFMPILTASSSALFSRESASKHWKTTA